MPPKLLRNIESFSKNLLKKCRIASGDAVGFEPTIPVPKTSFQPMKRSIPMTRPARLYPVVNTIHKHVHVSLKVWTINRFYLSIRNHSWRIISGGEVIFKAVVGL